MSRKDEPNKVPQRSIRIEDDLWRAAKHQAIDEGTTVTDEIKRHLTRWTRKKS